MDRLGHAEDAAATPKAQHVAGQIRARRLPTWDAWGDDPDRRAAAVVVCQEIQKEFGWPNDHYLPDDPLRLLIWTAAPDVEILFALGEVRRRLGVRALPPADFDYANATLDDLVDRIVRVAKVQSASRHQLFDRRNPTHFQDPGGRSLPCRP